MSSNLLWFKLTLDKDPRRKEYCVQAETLVEAKEIFARLRYDQNILAVSVLTDKEHELWYSENRAIKPDTPPQRNPNVENLEQPLRVKSPHINPDRPPILPPGAEYDPNPPGGKPNRNPRAKKPRDNEDRYSDRERGERRREREVRGKFR